MNIETDKKKFLKKVIACDLGLFMFATLIFASTRFSFGITLFGLGILVCSLSNWAGAVKQLTHGLVSPLYEYTTEGAFFSGRVHCNLGKFPASLSTYVWVVEKIKLKGNTLK